MFLHQAFYETRPQTDAVVHLHSTYATALSCLPGIDPTDCIEPLTPYVVMRVGRVPLLRYVKPGDPAMGAMIRALKGASAGLLSWPTTRGVLLVRALVEGKNGANAPVTYANSRREMARRR
ncbi:class II aldolase/adducin family protein [Roseixanthobacter psychrophilus]|uniref:class II aldolase/adducin family protein n=1 Tax=Roseixanthobacter psychrophilus TaxID=3119917 RepID=UPI003D216556